MLSKKSSIIIILSVCLVILGISIWSLVDFINKKKNDDPEISGYSGTFFIIINALVIGTAVIGGAIMIWMLYYKPKEKPFKFEYTGFTYEKKDPLADYDMVTETTKRTELVPGENDRVINEINYVTVNHNFYPKKPE